MRVIISIVIALMSTTAVHAAAVLDQSNVVPTWPGPTVYGASASHDDFRRAQTVTAGMTGTLTEVDFEVGTNTQKLPPFTGLNILATSGGIPTDQIIGTGTFEGYGADGFASFSLSLAITAGEVFAIEAIGPSVLGFYGSFANPYAGGGDFYLNPEFDVTSFTADSDTVIAGGADDGFRTYVDPGSAVPEPAGWILMVGGFGIAGYSLRRRNVAFA